tara:strand:+ start:810 stop:1256 length:447 start_codon:yes stop_codon:yes gene_type:complete
MDPFSLAVAALTFANSFGGSGDPSGGSGGMDIPSSKKTSSSFLDFDFIKGGAKAYVAARDKKEKPFKSAEFPKTRSVSELTSPKPFRPVGDMRFITGSENPDIQNAMRMLARSSNRDVVRLIPMDIVSPVKKQTKNIQLGSSKLGKIE